MLIEYFLPVCVSIAKAHIIIAVILLFSFIIEHTTTFRLFFKDFVRPKSPKRAQVADDGNIGTYLIIMIGTVIYDIYYGSVIANIYTISFAFIIIFFLTKYSYRIHKKYQRVDPKKPDNDYS